MPADHFGRLAFFVMAAHRITYLIVQSGQIVGFSKDGRAEGAGGVAAFRHFFNNEFILKAISRMV